MWDSGVRDRWLGSQNIGSHLICLCREIHSDLDIDAFSKIAIRNGSVQGRSRDIFAGFTFIERDTRA